MNITAKTIREQLEHLTSDYDVDEFGLISSPGQFEKEPVKTLYFHDCVMNGGGDETFFDGDTQYDVFILNRSEKEALELDNEDYAAIYYEDSNGFVYCPIITEEDYLNFLIDIEGGD